MAEFKIKIAGHTAAVRSLFESTRDYCGRYLSEDEPGVTLTVSPDDLIFEQAQYDQEALEEGFRRYSVRRVLSKGDKVGTVDVLGGEMSSVELMAAEDFFYSMAEDETAQLALPGPGFLYAPVVEGADAGYVYVLINGNAVGKVPVICGRTVEQFAQQEEGFWQRIRKRQ